MATLLFPAWCFARALRPGVPGLGQRVEGLSGLTSPGPVQLPLLGLGPLRAWSPGSLPSVLPTPPHPQLSSFLALSWDSLLPSTCLRSVPMPPQLPMTCSPAPGLCPRPSVPGPSSRLPGSCADKGVLCGLAALAGRRGAGSALLMKRGPLLSLLRRSISFWGLDAFLAGPMMDAPAAPACPPAFPPAPSRSASTRPRLLPCCLGTASPFLAREGSPGALQWEAASGRATPPCSPLL